MATSARTITASIAVAALGLALGGCSSADTGNESKRVTIIVHDSFPNEEFAAAASAATGYEVEVVTAGDGGELTNKLVLTKGAPVADVFFGVDNTFASRLVEHGAVVPYTPANLPASAGERAFDEEGSLAPVDLGATCVNIDTGWFAEKGLAEPESYEDLAKPEYKGLTVLLDPAASSTGGSFLVGTVARFGEDGFADYWKSLIDNGARIEQGWEEAYNGRFTQGGADGTYPIVVSYSTSPAFTVNEDGTASTTRALLDTCSTQVEFAGVLAGAANPEGAKAVVDFLVSPEFQATIPDAMYMYPVDDSAALPESWAKFAPMPSPQQSNDLAPAEIEQGRETWLKTLDEKLGQ